MIVLEYKVKGKLDQFKAIDQAICTTQFIRNKAIRYWMDNSRELKIDKFALNKYSTALRKEFSFVNDLNSMAVQSAAERGWTAISRFYDNCQKKISGKKGYPKFQKDCRSVEYKTTGWKLHPTKRQVTFTDKNGIGNLKLLGKWDLHTYNLKDIKRVRLIRRADGYYCQFCLGITVTDVQPKTGNEIGIDVGIESFYTDSNGHQEPNPQFLRKAETSIKKSQRQIYKKVKGSSGRRRARKIYAKKHLKVSRQRNEHAKITARNVCKSNDLVVYEDLSVRNLVKNHCLAKSISDASWYLFRQWIEYFAAKFDKLAIPVAPHFTSQKCSNCGGIVKKSLSTRTHICNCGCELHRDTNAAINILNLAKQTRDGQSRSNATGVGVSTLLGATLVEQILTQNVESPSLQSGECQYTSYIQTLQGTKNGNKLSLNITTKIELDTQKTKETWTLTSDSLNTGRVVYKKQPCLVSQIRFAPGKNSATVSQSVVRGSRDIYLLKANQGQRMDVKMTSLENNAVFDVIAPNGQVLKTEATQSSLKLPATGTYEIIVGGTRGNATYQLNVKIQ